MNKFRRWLRKWLQEEDRVQECYPEPYPNKMSTRGRSINTGLSVDNELGTINFRVYGARGGKIIEVSHYDPAIDRSNTLLYVINDDSDFTQELGKIVTMESMR